MERWNRGTVELLLLLFLSTSASAQSLAERMLQAEDARPTTEAGLAPIYEGLKGGGRRTAIRTIGRFERPEVGSPGTELEFAL